MNYEGACTERQINCSRGLRMSKKSSNFVVETDYAEEIPTCRDLALRPFLLSEKSEIFRVAMRGGGGGHILRRLNEWLAESCKFQVERGEMSGGMVAADI